MGMTKKRFRIISDEDFELEYIADKKTFKSMSNLDSCCDMLNQLYEENEQLKQELLSKNDVIQQLQNNLKTDDRDELLKYRRKFSDACIELSDLNRDIRCLNRENKELKKENEQLKSENKNFKRINNICEEQISELRRLVHIATHNGFIRDDKKSEWKKELMGGEE